ncbi:MAG: hypothetical protein IT236_09070 [Bacteroidia bacterium]|nr:hypothetical protein [Bacteroidia bacterium]
MELVLKLPKGKPPFIGVLFGVEQQHSGEKMHADMVQKYGRANYRIVLEHTPSALNMRLICEEHVVVYFYNHLSYDAERLKSWLYITKHNTLFNFGHVGKLTNNHQLLLSMPERKKFFVKVISVEFITVEDTDVDLPYTTNYRKW